MSKVSDWVVRYSELRETYNMTDSIDKLVEEVAASLNRQGWTRYPEILPLKDGEYICYDETRDRFFVCYFTMYKNEWGYLTTVKEVVSHYMPLPNKPEPI